jgi:predicted nucleic acid-binding protein
VSEAVRWQNPNWANWINWLKRASVLLGDPPVKRIVRRDPNDDPVVAAAVFARAQYLIAYDRDLLALKKPYGVLCIPPRDFISAVLSG